MKMYLCLLLNALFNHMLAVDSYYFITSVWWTHSDTPSISTIEQLCQWGCPLASMWWIFWIGQPAGFPSVLRGEEFLNWPLVVASSSTVESRSSESFCKPYRGYHFLRTPHTLTSPNDVYHLVNLSNTKLIPYMASWN